MENIAVPTVLLYNIMYDGNPKECFIKGVLIEYD